MKSRFVNCVLLTFAIVLLLETTGYAVNLIAGAVSYDPQAFEEHTYQGQLSRLCERRARLGISISRFITEVKSSIKEYEAILEKEGEKSPKAQEKLTDIRSSCKTLITALVLDITLKVTQRNLEQAMGTKTPISKTDLIESQNSEIKRIEQFQKSPQDIQDIRVFLSGFYSYNNER